MDKKGFTLAEVLITLGIIGVVAAMTIPTLIQNYNKRTWDTGATVFERKLEEALKTMNGTIWYTDFRYGLSTPQAICIGNQ